MKTNYCAEHTLALKRELAASLDRQGLQALQVRRPVRHFLILGRQLILLGGGILGVLWCRNSWWWIPFALLEGLTVFNFTVLLHEVLHHLVFPRPHPRASRILEWAYSLPSGLSPSQFTRWHLDHHAELGSSEGDPKRHYLSPRINRRWLKILYFTPALFFIYFRAAARESASYPPDLRRRIAGERAISTVFQLGFLASTWILAGWSVAAKVYCVPIFIVFPIAFALNRLGQHYDIRPEDPAQWSTLIQPNWFWDFAWLWSNYHLEHHYFPGVPFYNLPKLHQMLRPFFQKRGIRARGYGELLYQYLVLNRTPHSNWSG